MSNISDDSVSYTLSLSSNSKLLALEKTLHQSIIEFQELAKEVKVLHIESMDTKKQLLTQKEKCESKHCSSSEALMKIIECKDNIIQSVASALTKLNETKNFNILKEIFKTLCGDTTITEPKIEPQHVKVLKENMFSPLTPKKELFDSTTDVSMKDESVSEIEGTPTGRTSPIIQSRKPRNGCVTSSSDYRDKKKCPDSWSTPENKAMKLTFPLNSKRGKWRQGRLNLVTVKPSTVVDLTSSPELMTVNKNSQSESNVQLLVKKESTDNDDTILPSPTSGYPSLLKNNVNSPMKFKRPLCLKNKSEVKIEKSNLENSPIKVFPSRNEDPEESINLLKPVRFITKLDENSPTKVKPMDDDETHCEIPSSLSILEHHALEQEGGSPLKPVSPAKRPLGENQNIINMHDRVDTNASMSLLHPEPKLPKVSPEDMAKRKLPAPVEPIYKEPTVRKKAEKRALPGWNCDECKNFYDELYADDPEMLAKKMDECSKHRGKNNPARPKTPEGFWNPRWSVPRDTEEFNRRNNAA
ncbi:hypothetical protein ABMA28_017053 [Loxostege sticticalis]|uniref:DNA endonuclease RBBP8 n=1 Tax=Loxostege sticticalis TaxID=481309 RepID=A0ABD0T8K7_LOXSC